jgi:hypothetical protein
MCDLDDVPVSCEVFGSMSLHPRRVRSPRRHISSKESFGSKIEVSSMDLIPQELLWRLDVRFFARLDQARKYQCYLVLMTNFEVLSVY